MLAHKQLAALAKEVHSMRRFALACQNLSSDDIYLLFEDEITQDLRDEIYATFWSISPEPTRAALRQLGERYDIVSLQKY
jgi:hypothetical protein